MGVYIGGLYELEEDETKHLIRAELEKIIWGQVFSETAMALDRIRNEID